MTEEPLPQSPSHAHTPSSPPSTIRKALAAKNEPHHLDDDEEDERTATELTHLPEAHTRKSSERQQWTWRPELIRAETSEERLEEEQHRRHGLQYNKYKLVKKSVKWYDGFLAVWKREISVKVDAQHRRDHLALERTFLGYLRTSVALSMAGVTIAQLFRLQHSYNPSKEFGYFVAGIPIATCFIGAAIVVVLLGAVRFWRQQSAMRRGKVWAGGWEVNLIMILSILLGAGLFTVTLGVSIRHELDD